MTSRKMLIWLGACLAIYFLLVLATNPPAAQTPFPVGTSFSPNSDGAKGLYTLFSEAPALGADRITFEPQTGLFNDSEILLLEPLADDDQKSASAWIQLANHGSRIVELTDKPTPLLSALHIRMGPVIRKPFTSIREATQTGRILGTWSIAQSALRGLSGQLPGDIQWLTSDKAGTKILVGMERKIGAGSVTVFSLSAIAYNANIEKADHLGVLLALLQPDKETIGFAETIHGFADTPGAFAILGPGVQAASIIFLLALILWLWGQGKRFGQPEPFFTPAIAANIQFAEAIAKLYERKRNFRVLFDQLQALSKERTGETLFPTGDHDALSRREYLAMVNRTIQHLNHKGKHRKAGDRVQ